MASVGSFEVNQVVLIRWQDGNIYYARIGMGCLFQSDCSEKINKKEQKCHVRFEDKSVGWVPMANMHAGPVPACDGAK